MSATPLTPEMMAELDKLRDIRLPDPVGWWPLAPGWWALMGLCVLVLAGVAFAEWRRRRTVRYLALMELSALKGRLASGDAPHPISVDLAVLLRRINQHGGRQRVDPGLADTDWARELTQGEAGLSDDVAGFLVQAPYAQNAREAEQLLLKTALTESEHWIRRNAA